MTAYGAYGTLVKQGTTTIGQVRSAGITVEKETIDVTHLSSTSRWREKLSSLRTWSINFEVLLDPVLASHEILEDQIAADTSAAWSLVWSDAAPTTWSGSAIARNFQGNANLGDALVATFELEGTGALTTD